MDKFIPFPHHPALAVTRLFSAVNDWRDSALTRAHLSRLSDHELEDLGLCRGDIARMSRG